jgi:hypothetical protein
VSGSTHRNHGRPAPASDAATGPAAPQSPASGEAIAPLNIGHAIEV